MWYIILLFIPIFYYIYSLRQRIASGLQNELKLFNHISALEAKMTELTDEISGYKDQNSRMEDMQRRLLTEQERMSDSQSKQEQQIAKRANEIAEAYLQKEEKRIRADAVEKSKSVVQGKVTENLIPYFDVCKYNPRDMRFFGSPLDFIIFDGLDEGVMRKIVFVEVKTGKSKLSGREKLVKKCITDKLIEYEIWTI